jgi:hypothetical protein
MVEGDEMTTEEMMDQIRRIKRSLAMRDLDELTPQPMAVERGKVDRAATVIQRSIVLWNENIIEPHKSGKPVNSASDIDWLIRDPDCANWNWLEQYTHNGQTAWCGFAQAYAFRAAGLKDHIVQKVLPSCCRLKKFARENDRFVDKADMQPGDIVLVDSTGDGNANHITLCWADAESVDPPEYVKAYEAGGSDDYDTPGYITLEGNAKGLLPDGRKVEGYVARTRPLEQVTHVIRFQGADYE